MTIPKTSSLNSTSLRSLIADDSYVMAFQTVGQYRTALLQHADALAAQSQGAQATAFANDGREPDWRSYAAAEAAQQAAAPVALDDQARLDWLIENDAMVYRGDRFLVARPNRAGIEGWGFASTPRAAIDAAMNHGVPRAATSAPRTPEAPVRRHAQRRAGPGGWK